MQCPSRSCPVGSSAEDQDEEEEGRRRKMRKRRRLNAHGQQPLRLVRVSKINNQSLNSHPQSLNVISKSPPLLFLIHKLHRHHSCSLFVLSSISFIQE
ncbi:hypothetical protein FQA47_018820 [Oryzias melastigma]|uniref:Uncharacterized protein n=1 Tax=Oryzias melastigma TaxID=30732 RepID=A0A834EY91_ORYME|nr:hypothetical protein FQA47_018820 [Oryzias melastigma]